MNAQVIEKAINNKNKTLDLMNAFVNSTYKGNTIDDFYDYNIDTKKVGKQTLILKILKFKNFKENTAYILDQFTKDTIKFGKQSRQFKDSKATNIIKQVINIKALFLITKKT